MSSTPLRHAALALAILASLSACKPAADGAHAEPSQVCVTEETEFQTALAGRPVQEADWVPQTQEPPDGT